MCGDSETGYNSSVKGHDRYKQAAHHELVSKVILVFTLNSKKTIKME